MIIKPQTFQAQEIFRRQRREFLQLCSAGSISNPSGANQDNHLFSVSGIKRQCGRFSGWVSDGSKEMLCQHFWFGGFLGRIFDQFCVITHRSLLILPNWTYSPKMLHDKSVDECFYLRSYDFLFSPFCLEISFLIV